MNFTRTASKRIFFLCVTVALWCVRFCGNQT